MAKATGETEFITFGGFKHHCMGRDNVRFVYMGRGNVRFVSGHRFSDDANARKKETAFRRWVECRFRFAMLIDRT